MLWQVIGFFSSRLQRVQEQSELGVHEVLVTINKGSTQWSKDRLRVIKYLKKKYVHYFNIFMLFIRNFRN